MGGGFEWSEYYDEYEDREPRATLLETLDSFEPGERFAVDLGCGQGVDTLAMLERGWSVLAIDAETEAIDRVRRRVPPDLSPRLRTLVDPMEDVEIPAADLVWAGFSLFFCDPSRFPDVWARIEGAVRSGGRFGGHLLGDRDTWAGRDGFSWFAMGDARALFEPGYVVERFEEVEEDEEDDDGDRGWKHWHVFHVVARRR